MKKLAIISALLVVMAWSALAQTKEAAPYVTDKDVNLLILLAPPAAADSPEFRAELNAVLDIQKNRTKAQSDLAVADDEEAVWRFAASIDNANFTKEKLPVFTAFFDRVVATEPAIVDSAKDNWKRPRPYMADEKINPLTKKKKSGAYPSGHATIGTLMGILLANMVPEKRPALMARAYEFGYNRLIAGQHVISDVQAGRQAGSAIAAVLFTRPDFQKEFEAAKAELRLVLGYK